MEEYRLHAVRALAEQLLRGPKRLRIRQLLGIEFLLSIIEAGKSYPYDFVCHALTGYRPTASAPGNGRLLPGDDLLIDLMSLALDVSEAADIGPDVWPERLYSAAELAGRFDVSTKTIFRWRRRGLVGWKVRGGDQRLRLVFPDRSVRRFVGQNADVVQRGSNFSQLTKAEREEIVLRARQLVEDGLRTVNAVARTIAGERGRAVETIRLILKHYDEAHPAAGIFNRSAMRSEVDGQRLAIWEAHQEGASVEALARRFEKPASWIYETIHEMRVREMQARKIEFVGSHEFEAPEAERELLTPAPSVPLREALGDGARRVPAGLPPYLANLFRIPLLTRAGELYLFRKMNYLKYRAQQMISRLDPETSRPRDLDAIDEVLSQAADVKNEIVQANLRLVVSIAKRHVQPGQDLFELISDGNVSLMRAVDKFDYTRGFKFSTYASWAIMKNFARSIPEQRRHGERYQTGWDELLDSAMGYADSGDNDSEHLANVRGVLDRMLSTLDVRERMILRQRYGLDDRGQPQTLEQIGRRFGISKERIRQLEVRAMTKLRGGFEADVERVLGA